MIINGIGYRNLSRIERIFFGDIPPEIPVNTGCIDK
jgi:hypothetical protein